MNKTGAFRVPNQEPGSLHLYKVAGSGVRRGFTAAGIEWNEFDVDLFADEEPSECDMCKKTAASGWRCGDGGRELCKGCVVPHAGPFEPCVLFHKFSRRCWSDDEAQRVNRGWSSEREKATVYPHLAAAEESRQGFLDVVQKAVLVVPIADFDTVLARYQEDV